MNIETEISGIKLGDKHPIRILGVINLSVESFYKDSVSKDPHEVLKTAERFIEEGANYLDIGARSTAPGVKPISIEEELNRLIPSLKTILKNFEIPISVDTQYSNVAEKSLNLGARIINDVSGFKTDPKIMKVIVDNGADTIIMATEKVPGDCLGIEQTLYELKGSIQNIVDLGLNPNSIIIDPGIGRWIPPKIFFYNLELIDQLHKFRVLKKPILVGISRKSFIGDILNYPDPKDRLIGSLACTSIAVYNGAHIIRAHDVKESRDVAKISWYVKNYLKFK